MRGARFWGGGSAWDASYAALVLFKLYWEAEMRLKVLTAIAVVTLAASSVQAADGTGEGGERGQRTAELVVAITPDGTYLLCGHVEGRPLIRARLAIVAVATPQPPLRAFVEGGIASPAGVKALHELLIDASDSGITHIVIDQPLPNESAVPPKGITC